MNLLDAIKKILGFQDWKETSALPGWRGRKTFQRKSRTPFSSSRRREIGPQRMYVEEFQDKTERDARFRQLRESGTRNVTKFSTVRENRSLWCVVRP